MISSLTVSVSDQACPCETEELSVRCQVFSCLPEGVNLSGVSDHFKGRIEIVHLTLVT